MPIRAETRSRALALRLLYAWEVGGGGGTTNAAAPGASPPPGDASAAEDGEASARAADRWAAVVRLLGSRPEVEERALRLAESVLARRLALDRRIAAAAAHWRVERLAVVDRNVLRLAVLELEEGGTPPRVAIDEAVRLARWFGGEKSSAFVNGILDRVAHDLGRL